MSDNMLCFLVALIVFAFLGLLVYLGLSWKSSDRGDSKYAETKKGYESARTWDQKIVYFIFGVLYLVLVTTVLSFLLAVGGLAVSVLASICGNNPWPYLLEAWKEWLDSRKNDEEDVVGRLISLGRSIA